MFIAVTELLNIDGWSLIILLTALVAVEITTIIHIILNKSEKPTSALLWIFVIVYLNIFGIFLYLILGIERFHYKKKRVGRFDEKMDAEKQKQHSIISYFEHLEKFSIKHWEEKQYQQILDIALPGTRVRKGNSVKLLVDGTMAYPEMVKEINNAKEFIFLQSYIIANDEVSNKIFEALDKKANEGVRVKVLFDSLGSRKAFKSGFFKKWIKKTKSPNFEVAPFSKLDLLAPYRIQFRNHRKLLICDGHVAFHGGINISAENDMKRIVRVKHIHDLHYKIEGPSVGELQYHFIRDWSTATRQDPVNVINEFDYFKKVGKQGDATIRVVASGVGQAHEASYNMFLNSAANAKSEIIILTPYFIPPSSFLRVLKLATARGVKIKLIIPQNNNHWYAKYASRNTYDRLLMAGVEIFEKQGRFSHIKAMLVDQKWAVMGSSNCDVRSFKLNYELDCIIEDKIFIDELSNQILSELDKSQKITLGSRKKRTLKEEILEGFSSLFTPVL